MNWRQAFKDIPAYVMQTLRNMRDAPLHAWVINLLYLGILIMGCGFWIAWIVNGEEVSELIGNIKGMSIFIFIFVFVAYRMAWDWILIRLGYMPPYDKSV